MSSSFVERGGLWVTGQFVLLAVVLLSALGAEWDVSSTVHRWAALTLLATGAWLGIAGVIALGNNLTPFTKPHDDAHLVRHGVFSLVRHPLYASLMLLCAGWSLLWLSVAGGLATGLLALLLDAKARREEVWLRAKFPEYADYERRVKRLVPGVY